MRTVSFPSILLVLMLVSQSKGFCTMDDFLRLAEYSFTFPEQSTIYHAVRTNAIANHLGAFTLSFFVKMDNSGTGSQCVFSYATPESIYGNGLYVCMSPTIQIGITNYGERVTDVTIPRDGQLHHVSVTWENSDGNYKVYLDGKLAKSGTGLMKGYVIPPGGTAVIGQDQDTMGGGFQMWDAFGPGVISALNMFDTVLPESEISKQSESCQIPRGSVLGIYQF